MPDGTVLYRARDVDRYYGLGFGTTSQRIFHGWSDERCANNQRARSTHLRKGNKDFNFNMILKLYTYMLP